MIRFWQKRLSALSVNGVNGVNAVRHKEKGKGKENIPPAPPIEKREIQEKTAAAAARAHTRVREGCSYVGPLWEDVLRYAKRAKIDAEYAHWWYGQMDALGWCNPDCITDPVGNWRSLLRVWWLKRGKSGDDWKRPVEKLPRKYSAEEWRLCAERCQHFDSKLCRCRAGGTVPPDLREHPTTPEECLRFNRKGE